MFARPVSMFVSNVPFVYNALFEKPSHGRHTPTGNAALPAEVSRPQTPPMSTAAADVPEKLIPKEPGRSRVDLQNALELDAAASIE